MGLVWRVVFVCLTPQTYEYVDSAFELGHPGARRFRHRHFYMQNIQSGVEGGWSVLRMLS